MEENQIEALIEVYKNEIDLKKFNNIIMAAFSGNEKIKCYSLKEYYNYSIKRLNSKEIKEIQFEFVLNYLVTYHKNHISFMKANKKYHTEISSPYSINLNQEKEILKVLEIYNKKH